MKYRKKTIIFITGASGVGKTTLVSQLKMKYVNLPFSFFHFDSIGVPSEAEMKNEFGSPTGWQEAKTNEWIDRLIHESQDKTIVLEGQVNVQFIVNGFRRHEFNNYKIILLDSSEETMGERLTDKRAQPELFNHNMRNWLRFLRNQAKELGAPVIDTTNLSPEEVMKKFEEIVSAKRIG